MFRGQNVRREVDLATARAEPLAVWNAFVDLIATEEFEALSPVQQGAHLLFWYESEVEHGGHRQFFVNGGTVHVHETVAALRECGLGCQADILRQAADVWLSSERTFLETGEEAASEPLDDGFAEHDAAFHECDPDIIQALESHLEQHQDEYVALVERGAAE